MATLICPMALMLLRSRQMNNNEGFHLSGIAGLALHHSKAITIIVVGLCAWGISSIFILPSGIYPDVAFPRIVVIAERGEDSVENMMIGVTRPMEEAINAVPGLVRVRSTTIRGACEMSLDFSEKTDMREALSQTRARIASLLPELPAGIETTIEQQTPSVFPCLSFNVSLDPAKVTGLVRDGADLDQWVKNDLKPRLSRLQDVFLVTVQGAEIRQIVVEPNPLRLAETHVSLLDLIQILEESNEVIAVGRLEKDYKQFQLLASYELQSVDDIAALPIVTRSGKTIHLRDVADVSIGLADKTSVVTGNGKDAVVVSLFMRFEGKITDLSDHVLKTIDEITPKLPPGVSITPVYNQAELVRDSLGGVRDAIILGMILAIVVLWIFLGSWRLTFIAGISIPITILGTFAIMWIMGESLNLMSLGGIAVAVGIIIDDAIVVVENIARWLKTDKEDIKKVVRDATKQITGAVVGSSLTIVVVFIPLVLLEGIAGQFFTAMAISLSIGIVVSMVMSLTLTPILSAGKIGPRPGESTTRRWMEFIAGYYEKSIHKILHHPWVTTCIILCIAAIGITFAAQQATGFLPSMDEGCFVLDYFMPVGTSLLETDKNCRKIEEILMQVPEIKSFSRRTGMELGFFVTEQYTGDFLIGLKGLKERERSTEEIINQLREQILHEIPQIEVEFVQIMQDQLNDMAGESAPLDVKIFGNDYKVIQNMADSIVGIMETVPGVVDIESGVSFGSPEITYQLDSDAVSRAGLTITDAEEQLRIALLGQEATKIRRSNYLEPVVVRYSDTIRHDPTWLAQIPIANGAGDIIPASSICQMDEKTNVNELARENQQPLVSVTANLSGRDLGSTASELQAKLSSLLLPSGVRVELSGQIESQRNAFRNLLLVLVLAIGLVFLLLVMQFHSYSLPLIIFLTIPFSQIGALLALRWTNTELNISSFMGLILLVGVVVKNGILLIEYTEQLRQEGTGNIIEALAIAGRTRLRPIFMTSLTTLIALFPLALNVGAGAELQRPLAIAVIGGLTISTIFTLIVIPTAYLQLSGSSKEK
jgi:CzcA family heavy metal efflux pump